MISRIEARNYRCLRYVSQELSPFHVLVGPNASGKSTFLDVVAFLGRLVSDGLDAAVGERTANPADLVWAREGDSFELAIEAEIPEALREGLDRPFDRVRYEVEVTLADEAGGLALSGEKVGLLRRGRDAVETKRRDGFPQDRECPDTIPLNRGHPTREVVTRGPGYEAVYRHEVREEGKLMPALPFKLGPGRSALGNLPEDEINFPVSTWLKSFLSEGVQQLLLNSLVIRRASPPTNTKGFQPDGSSLPWLIHRLEQEHPKSLALWLSHLQTAFPDLTGVRTIERPDDRHRYSMLRYKNGIEVPSWMVSDGTLRVLALTLLAYVPHIQGCFLIEEPENGVHPQAIETIYQSLTSVYDAQVLMATHSPVLLSIAKAENLLCFAKTPSGETDTTRGDRHPLLRDWRGGTDLGTLFASGILG